MTSRFVSSCAVVGLLVLPPSYAAATPTGAQLRSHRAPMSDGEARVAVGSHGLILASAMTDRLKQRNVFPEKEHSSQRGDHQPSRGGFGPGRSGHESGGPSAPIPEPSSILMFGAGGALVAFAVRRKLA
jgi:hypothetical protein